VRGKYRHDCIHLRRQVKCAIALATKERFDARSSELSLETAADGRATHASFLMAAGYNLKQIQEYLGHADLVTTARYIKNLPVPRGTTERAKLEAYLEQEIGDI
jgi:integrase